MRSGLRSALFLLVTTVPSAVAAQCRGTVASLDGYVERAMTTWKVPGVALAVVRNDSVVCARGFGVRTMGRNELVDERTIFAIGSSSKAFTATSVAMLVDEGKMRWNDKATAVLPGFRLFDPYATHDLTVRDLLSHRSGLARGDVLWHGSDLSREEILRRVRFLEPSAGFRSLFQYQNIMYLAAGQAVAAVSGRSWDDFVTTRILEPLGMTASNTSVRSLRGLDNVASPHAELKDTVRAIPWRDIDNIAPAGAINSNAADMAQWVRFNLSRGTVGGRALVTAQSFAELWQPNTAIRLEGSLALLFPDAHLMSYGMGWFLQDYRGHFLVHHGGNIDGMSAIVALLPDDRMGLVVLTNMNSSPIVTVLMYHILDDLLGGGTKDWGDVIKRSYDAQVARARETVARQRAQRHPGTHPSLPLSEYAGTYVDSLYGAFEVGEHDGRLTARYGRAYHATLEHWHFDTFRAEWDDATLGSALIQFVLGADGRVAQAKVQGIADFARR